MSTEVSSGEFDPESHESYLPDEFSPEESWALLTAASFLGRYTTSSILEGQLDAAQRELDEAVRAGTDAKEIERKRHECHKWHELKLLTDAVRHEVLPDNNSNG